MEKGSLRCDANVSVRRAGSGEFGTKTELKNMNSFKFLGDGMAAEIRRQIDLLERGLQVVQETLHYDPGTKSLRSLRSKEEAHDYRYFPEPDLVPLAPSPELIERLRDGLPELPAARIERFTSQHGLPSAYATDLNAEPRLADYFEAVAASSDAKSAADWVLNTRPAPVDTVPAATLASLIGLIAGGTITNSIARQVYELLVADPTADPAELVERHGLASIGDSGELEAMVDEVIAENPAFVEQFQSGKDGVINALVGQVMKRTQGRADARQVQELLRSKL
jgi:aspartyl-tRNA(Asn)/glutamyl-tRNA(Gln) amidotransferase subunit B